MAFWRKQFKPARSAAAGVDSVVRDLDALIAEPIPFRFSGEVHFIEPITTASLLILLDKFARFDKIARDKALSVEHLVDSYLEIFSAACPTIKKHHVENMNQAQASALFQLIFDSCTGRAQSERVERKKKLKELEQKDLT